MYGVDTLVRIFSHFAFIYLAFWGLQAMRLDLLFKGAAILQTNASCFCLISYPNWL